MYKARFFVFRRSTCSSAGCATNPNTSSWKDELLWSRTTVARDWSWLLLLILPGLAGLVCFAWSRLCCNTKELLMIKAGNRSWLHYCRTFCSGCEKLPVLYVKQKSLGEHAILEYGIEADQSLFCTCRSCLVVKFFNRECNGYITCTYDCLRIAHHHKSIDVNRKL